MVDAIKAIPRGKVSTYGQIAAHAGNARAARQVAYILHSSWRKENLPWHRVVNSKGGISVRPSHAYELQKSLLKEEGIVFEEEDRIELTRFLWIP